MKKLIVLLILLWLCVPVWADPHTADIYWDYDAVDRKLYELTKDISYWDTNQEIRLFRIEQTLKRQQEKIEELQKQIDEIKCRDHVIKYWIEENPVGVPNAQFNTPFGQ